MLVQDKVSRQIQYVKGDKTGMCYAYIYSTGLGNREMGALASTYYTCDRLAEKYGVSIKVIREK
jgi:intergrase/recombinase